MLAPAFYIVEFTLIFNLKNNKNVDFDLYGTFVVLPDRCRNVKYIVNPLNIPTY